MLTSEQFFQHLRSALNHLYDPYFLRKSPLIKVFDLGDQPDTPSVLQRILNEAIEKMEPKSGDASLAQQRRNFELIMYRYVQQFNQEEVANQLGLSVRHLRREQNTAIYDLAARLWNQYHIDSKPFQISLQEMEEPLQANDPAAAGDSIPGGEDAPAANDLSWLENSATINPADLRQVLQAVIELSGPLAARYGVTFSLEMAPDLPLLAVEAVALRQLLLNVLSVGVRWHNDSVLTIQVEYAAACVNIHLVCSNSDQARRTLSTDEKSSIELAAQIARVYAGKLDSRLDEGCFQLSIQLPVYHQHIVMVVDDNLDFVQLVERYLTGTRYSAVSERNPRQAVATAEEVHPDLILLDVMMPNMDGWEVLGRLLRHPATAHLPVIICSIVPQKELATSLGAADFMRKPVSQEALLAALDRQIALLESSDLSGPKYH
jgi:CheY-like chemotaxis protein